MWRNVVGDAGSEAGRLMGPGQVSQGAPLFRGRRLLRPVPSPACLHRPPLRHWPLRTGPAPAPVEIRPAATVMLVRDAPVSSGGTSLEVLMVRRNLRSDFVGGAYVFPGGAVDPLDGGPEAEAICAGRTDAGASALLGFESGGLAYWVAVVRETFEEAGILLARREDGPDLLAGDPGEEARFATERAAVNQGTRRFLDLCRAEGLRLSAGDIHYFAHWITPRGAPRRYDTRFFVAAAPPGQIAAHDAGETIADVWISPHDALARHRAGEIEIIFPTIRNLQAIGRFATSAALLAGGRGGLERRPGHRATGRARRQRHAHRAARRPGLRARCRARPRRRRRARRLQRGGARGFHAGQRGRPRRRARAPPGGEKPTDRS